MEKERELNSLAITAGNCTECGLSDTRLNVVFGDGNINRGIMFIGEAPGKQEDLKGKPFVGDAGLFLDVLLKSIKLNRCDVYITNIVKCKPPENRDPLPIEMKACNGWLEKQIGIINPQIIVTLGRISLSRFVSGETISKIHGKARMINGRVIFCSYHPAACLYNGALKDVLRDDFRRLSLVLNKFRI